MLRYLTAMSVLLCANVSAEEELLRQGVTWLKSALPQGTQVTLDKSRLKFNGCKHREYQLNIIQPLTEKVSLEASLTRAKGQLNWGIHNQSVSVEKYSFIPRYKVSESLVLGAGMVYQKAPEFKTSQGFDEQLPKSQMLLISGQILSSANNHRVEVQLSSTKYAASNPTGTWLERGQSDNKISLSYEASF